MSNRDPVGREAPMVISPRGVVELTRLIALRPRELATKVRRTGGLAARVKP